MSSIYVCYRFQDQRRMVDARTSIFGETHVRKKCRLVLSPENGLLVFVHYVHHHILAFLQNGTASASVVSAISAYCQAKPGQEEGVVAVAVRRIAINNIRVSTNECSMYLVQLASIYLQP